MPVNQKLTTWVLGAGFSRSLNAPLFKDLFRHPYEVSAAYGGPVPPEMSIMLATYRKHASADVGGEGRNSGTFWDNAEEFLDSIESAKSKAGAAYSRMESAHIFDSIDIDALISVARRALAIECSRFLEGANLKLERWLPYKLWAANLSANDTVVTFNYDQIPDLLSANPDHSLGAPRLKVLVPDGDVRRDWDDIRGAFRCAPVLKLHGSVNWFADPRTGSIKRDESASLTVGSSPVLGVPGPSKEALLTEYRPVSVLWALARESLVAANRIVFIGYRFPPTDASARIQFLNCLRDARSLQNIDIVLGPDRNQPDVQRMEWLLKTVVPAATINVLPLGAEDYLPYSQ